MRVHLDAPSEHTVIPVAVTWLRQCSKEKTGDERQRADPLPIRVTTARLFEEQNCATKLKYYFRKALVVNTPNEQKLKSKERHQQICFLFMQPALIKNLSHCITRSVAAEIQVIDCTMVVKYEWAI